MLTSAPAEAKAALAAVQLTLPTSAGNTLLREQAVMVAAVVPS
jgi:hypothetical protein